MMSGMKHDDDIIIDDVLPTPQKQKVKITEELPEMVKLDSRLSLISKTSMTSSMLARNGFTSLKKRLHPVIQTRESKKRRYDVL